MTDHARAAVSGATATAIRLATRTAPNKAICDVVADDATGDVVRDSLPRVTSNTIDVHSARATREAAKKAAQE